jgi:hypothetical protein
MNCRTFRKSHVAFVDGLMNDRQSANMSAHLDACGGCERWNTAVRRGLLVARNLPSIRPSPDFLPRLKARLQAPDIQPPAPAERDSRWNAMVRLSGAVAVAVSGVLVVGAALAHSSPDTGPRTVAMLRTPTPATTHRRSVVTDSQLAKIMANAVPAWIPDEPGTDWSAPQLPGTELRAPSLSP